MASGILAYGGYLPKARLQRSEIVNAHRWYNPGLASLGKGERTMANWDEDAITMAVEAGRDGLGESEATSVGSVYMASTTFPFVDRQNSGVVALALNLSEEVATLDIGGSQRAATTALATACKVAAHEDRPALVIASEHRRTKAGSPLTLSVGDGAAAMLVGKGKVVATFVGSSTRAVDFVDHFRSEDQPFDYQWEERWVRDEGYRKLVPQTVARLLEETGISPDNIAHACLAAPSMREAAALGKMVGLGEGVIRDRLDQVCGDTGAAHPIVMLAHALETAKAGEKILVTGFGQGCDALIFEATDAIADFKPRLGIGGHLAQRREETNYHKFLAFNDIVELEHGLRAEADRGTALSTLYRNRATVTTMMGGRCEKCGALQFPKSKVCANPQCRAEDTQVDHPFANMAARLNSFTADRLTFTPNPPAYYGMVQFLDGGRVMIDFSDVDPDAELTVGMEMRMMFRVKDYDKNRGFRRYFWKAVPQYSSQGA